MACGVEGIHPERYAWGLLLFATGTGACANIIGADAWTLKEESPSKEGSLGEAGGAGGQGGVGGAGTGGSGGVAGSGGEAGAMSASSSGAGGGFPAACMDGEANGAETGVDCGGVDCAQCDICQPCLIDKDCKTGCCANNVCVYFVENLCNPSNTCPNGCMDGAETDLDCGGGGGCTIPCGPMKKCNLVTDCEQGLICDTSTHTCEEQLP